MLLQSGEGVSDIDEDHPTFAHESRNLIYQSRFPNDFRIKEVSRILNLDMPVRIAINEKYFIVNFDIFRSADEGEPLRQDKVNVAANLYLSKSLGIAAFMYGNDLLVPEDPIKTIDFDFGAVFSDNPETIMRLNKSLKLEWFDFNNGVSEGLKISPKCTRINSGWLSQHKAQELNAFHAGYLLGLGLNGHLHSLENWQAFEYLSKAHDMTSAALLLGLCASRRGTRDHKTLQVVSLYCPPMPQFDLPQPVPISQGVSLLAIGILYAGSADRYLTELILSELNKQALVNTTADFNYRSSYCMTAGLALGCITAGQGDSSLELLGVNLAERLHRCITPAEKVQAVIKNPIFFTSAIEENETEIMITSKGAICALGMAYMKTNNEHVAEQLLLPSLVPKINVVLPDVLMLRVLFGNLVLWSRIRPSVQWCNSCVPAALQKRKGMAEKQSMYAILVGACLAIGFRYAGTANSDAKAVLWHFFTYFERQSYNNGKLSNSDL